eukprot:TRINITY_DN339_c0_g1_i12.p1 TRINITY_DN339_c0_g1~~TRINITY_DN339_c0_g1_i12.p1  ORF type:complete len:721 (+),score=282.92 TRINITY_DN339_c0_g1_i12:87-2249(+)
MKVAAMKIFVALVLATVVPAAVASKGNPVMRVVNLLKDLSDKLEKEAKAEKDLYDKFVCWGTTTVNEKTKAVAEATERIEYLENYIKDIDSGAVWFTSEKEEIEAEIEAVNNTINGNAANRTDEHDDFLEEAEATEDGIEGLEVGVDALMDASAPSLISLRGSKSAADRLKAGSKLKTGLKMAQKYLSKADFTFMRDIITGHVSDVSAGKPAEPKVVGEYKSRLGGVIAKLKDVQATMTVDLEEDTKADHETQIAYEKRQKVKADEKAAAEALLSKLDREYAARDKAKAESREEIDLLTAQNTEDNSLIAEANAQLEEKAKLWDQRLAYRTGEQEAVGKAVELLHSDDARELFARSTSFLQLSAVSTAQVEAASSANKLLVEQAGISHDSRLLILATNLAKIGRDLKETPKIENPTFDAVLAKIDEMKQAIKDEEEADLNKKEECEATKTADTKTAKDHTNKIEDLNTTIDFLTSTIKQLEEDLAKKDGLIAEVNVSLANAKSVRDAENAEYATSKKDDEDAATLVQQAAKVISDFYEANPQSFLQMNSHSKEPEDMPKVFQSEYGGAGSQSSGIIQTMKMVEDDIRKEIAVADKEEAEALKMYEDTKKDLEDEKANLEASVDSDNIKKGDAQEDLSTAEKDKGDQLALLEAVNKKMKDAEPECNWYFENIETRSKNRLTELKGLDKAKAILNGAVFEDKSRALTVGDSLISKDIKRHNF